MSKCYCLHECAAFSQAIEKYNDSGRFGQSAKYQKEIAEIYEADNNVDMAMDHYQQAADLFNHDNKKQSANPCLLKVVILCAFRRFNTFVLQ